MWGRTLIGLGLVIAGCADGGGGEDDPRAGERGDVNSVLPVADAGADTSEVGDLGSDAAVPDAADAADLDAAEVEPDAAPDPDGGEADPDAGPDPDAGEADPDAADPDMAELDPDVAEPDAVPPAPDAFAVDPAAPADVRDLRAIPSDARVRVDWRAPEDPNWAGVVVVRALEPVAARPVDGQAYAADQALGNGQVIFVGDALRRLDAPLENDTRYHYAVFSFGGPEGPYSAGVHADATPRAPFPNGVDHHVATTLDEDVLRYNFAVGDGGDIHAVLTGTDGGERRLFYLRCAAPCDSADDWQRTLLTGGVSDRTEPSIALDDQGHPFIAIDGRYGQCSAGCEDRNNWTLIELPQRAQANATTRVALAPDGARWVAASSLAVWRCERACSNAANWQHLALGEATRLSDLAINVNGAMAITTSRWTGANYQSELWNCAGDCLVRDNWSDQRIEGSRGSFANADYRFSALDPNGAHLLTGFERRYRVCPNCAPGLPGAQYQLPQDQLYSYTGLALGLSAADQPRVIGSTGRPFFAYSVCDFDCAQEANWRTQQLGQQQPRSFRGGLDRRHLPLALFVAYGAENELRVLRAR